MIILRSEKYFLRRYLKREGENDKGKWAMYFAELQDKDGILYTLRIKEQLLNKDLEGKNVQIISTIDTKGEYEINRIEEQK